MMSATSVSDQTALSAWVNALARAGHSAPSADNSQTWRFVWDGKNLNVVFDTARGAGGLGRNHPVVQLAFGAVIENMVQAAVATGIEVENWDFRYLTREDGPFLVIPTPMPGGGAQQTPAWIVNRHTQRGKYFRNRLPDEVVTELTGQIEGDARIQVYNDPKAIQELARLVRAASEIRFQTEEVHRWLGENLRFTAAEVDRGDGLDVETLALPPGGRYLLKFITDWRRMAVLNRLHAYKLLALVEGAQFKQCGGVVAVVGSDSGPAPWIVAGRLMERVWLLLNRKELSVHPYFVLPDLFYRLEASLVPVHLREKAREIVASTRDFLELQDQTLFMVLRVGRAKIAPKRSKRLPLEAVLSHEK